MSRTGRQRLPRHASLLLFASLSSACATWPKPDLVDFFETDGGVRVEYARCDTPVESGEYTFQLHNVRLVDTRKVRTDPKFRFDRPALTELTGQQGNSLMRVLDNLRREACGDVWNYGPSQAELAGAFQDRVLKTMLEFALKTEKLNAEEEFKSEIRSTHAAFEGLRAERERRYAAMDTPG